MFGNLLDNVITAFETVWSWVIKVVDSFVLSNGQLKNLLPLMVITIGISVFLVAIKIIRSFTWGS